MMEVGFFSAALNKIFALHHFCILFVAFFYLVNSQRPINFKNKTGDTEK